MAAPYKVYAAVIETRFTEAQASGLKSRAALHGTSVNAVVREAVDAYLAAPTPTKGVIDDVKKPTKKKAKR